MKGLNTNKCYLIQHYFHHPNKFGGFDVCCLSALKNIISSDSIEPAVRYAGQDLLLQLNMCRSPFDVVPDQIFNIDGDWKWYPFVFDPKNEKSSIENFINECKANRLQRRKTVLV